MGISKSQPEVSVSQVFIASICNDIAVFATNVRVNVYPHREILYPHRGIVYNLRGNVY